MTEDREELALRLEREARETDDEEERVRLEDSAAEVRGESLLGVASKRTGLAR